MRYEIINSLSNNNDYYIFLRQNPEWHRILTRYPEQLSSFIEQYKTTRRKRFVDRLEDFSLMANILNSMPRD